MKDCLHGHFIDNLQPSATAVVGTHLHGIAACILYGISGASITSRSPFFPTKACTASTNMHKKSVNMLVFVVHGF